jgi:hypothetical protein
MEDVEGAGCEMEKYYIITIEVRNILLNETNESASPLFHHYKRLLRTRTHAMSNHPIPRVQISARSSAFDRSLLLLRFVALHCDVWFRVLWVCGCLFLILVDVDVDVEVDSEVCFSRGRTLFLVLFAYLKRARLCMRIPGFSVE